MIGREGKRWTYRCASCGAAETAPDLLRITEARNAHLRTTSHVMKAMEEAFRPVVEAYGEMAKTIIAVGDIFRDAFAPLAPPSNTPHGPAPKDKRVWGGK